MRKIRWKRRWLPRSKLKRTSRMPITCRKGHPKLWFLTYRLLLEICPTLTIFCSMDPIISDRRDDWLKIIRLVMQNIIREDCEFKYLFSQLVPPSINFHQPTLTSPSSAPKVQVKAPFSTTSSALDFQYLILPSPDKDAQKECGSTMSVNSTSSILKGLILSSDKCTKKFSRNKWPYFVWLWPMYC